MLQRIRDTLGAQKWLAYVVLGALALVFAAWGAYGIVNLNFGQTTYAAEVGGQKIPAETARNVWLRQQAQMSQRFGGELPASIKAGLQDQVLEGLIRDALLDEHTRELGYRVGNDELRKAIQSIPAFQINGQYDPNAAKAALAQSGLGIGTFEQELRASLQRNQLESGIAATDFLTERELARARELRNQERELRYAVVPAERYAAAAVLTDKDIESAYQAHLKQYMNPESARLDYAQLRLSQLIATQAVSDADLHAAYDKSRARLEVAEKRRARHILITPGKDDAAARRQAEELVAQIKAGKDFAELARKYSQDPGSASNGGELGWGERGTYVGPFGDALFSMSPGEVRGPVKTQFGHHIIQLEEVQSGKTKSLEEARPELETQLRKDRATDRFGEIQEKLQARLEQPDANLAAVAREFGLETGSIDRYVKGAGAEPLGAAQPLQDLVFGDTATAIGHIGGPVLLGDDRLVVVKVLERRPAQARPLSEVRGQVEAALRKERGAAEALKAAQAAQIRLAAGAAFDEVARGLDVKAEPARFAGRTDPSVPAPIRTAAFALPKPAAKPVYDVVPLDDGAALLAVTQVRSGPAPSSPEALRSEAQARTERQGVAEVEAYVAQLRAGASVRKNPKVFE